MDLDGDGDADILSGSYCSDVERDYMAGDFQMLQASPDGYAKAKPVLGSDGKILEITPHPGTPDADIDRICTRPTAVDLNGDGHLDIVSGNFGGTFAVFWGSKGGFAPENEWLLDGAGKRITVDMHSDPFFVDWDEDGDMDMLSGSAAGDVSLYVNGGSSKEPAFGKPVTLVEKSGGSYATLFGDAHLTRSQRSTRVVAADVNGDGKLDLLVGDTTSINTPAEGLTEEECMAKLVVWDKAFEKLAESSPLIEDWDNMTPEEEAAMDAFQAKMSKHYDKRAEIVDERGTGFVWLYKGK